MTESTEGKQVSVLGLGNMGSALAEALLGNGRIVTVWNRTASKCDDLAKSDARVAPSAAEAAKATQVTVVCVSDHDASMVLLQTDDVAGALRGKLLVQLSTVSAEESRALAHWAEENGIEYLDGSILAYPQHIRDNKATIVYSGPKNVFTANEDVLESLGGKAKLVGETIGSAPTFDKTIHAFHYSSMLAFFHGAAICHAAGFPIEIYVEQAASAGPGTMIGYGEQIAKRDYDNPGCMINVHADAYAHVANLSEELGIGVEFPKLVARIMERAIAEGRGEQELSAMFETLLNKTA